MGSSIIERVSSLWEESLAKLMQLTKIWSEFKVILSGGVLKFLAEEMRHINEMNWLQWYSHYH